VPRYRAILMLWFLALLPVAPFLFTSNALHWQTTTDCLNTLGRLAGVAGLSFMLVAAMLSSRVPGFDKLFGGLTKLWFTHHDLAAISFLLLLAHPLLLGFSAISVSLDAGVSLLFSLKGNAPVLIGWAALIVMMLFLAPSFSFFGEPKYQRWKLIHKLAAVALILALIHSFLLARQINYLWETILWSIYAGLAVMAIVYRWFFSRQIFFKTRGRLRYRVAKIERPLAGVAELTLAPEENKLAYEPGQFVYLTPFDKSLSAGCGQEHPFTISSAPHEAELRLAIKDLGDASRALQNVQIGSQARIEGPYGAFFPSSYDEDKELWIAGGIGVTPFLSRARHFVEQENEIDAHCFLCVQDEARALFREELQGLAARLPGFNLTMHYFYQEGPINKAFIEKHCPDFKHRACYICGPPPLLTCVQKFLRAAGVPNKRIHTEEFNLL